MRLSSINKALVKLAYHRVEPDGCHDSHIQNGAQVSSTTPYATLATKFPAVAIHRSNTDKRSYRAPIKLSKFRKVSQQRG